MLLSKPFVLVKELKENWSQNLTPVFLHIFDKFLEKEPTKFYDILNIFLEIMNLQSLERLDVRDVIPRMFKICAFQLFTMYWSKSLFGLRVSKVLFVFLVSFFIFVSFTFIAYAGNFNLWWVKVSSCKAIYCSNTTGKTPGKISYFQFPNPNPERQWGQIWFNNFSARYNINMMMLYVVVNSIEIAFNSKYKQNYFGMSQNEELEHSQLYCSTKRLAY